MIGASQPVHFLLVDDLEENLLSLEALLRRDDLVLLKARSGEEALEHLLRHDVALALLDVQMPGMDGFQVLESLEGALPSVIFVTAHDRYALRAFEVHALDYLLKPFDADRFRKAFERGRTQMERRTAGQSQRIAALLDEIAHDREMLQERLAAARAPEPQWMEWVMVKARGKIEFLRTDQVEWIEAEGNYVRLHSAGRGYLIREKISTLEERLDPERFMRVHRSTIVALEQITELRPLPSGDCILVLRDATELKLSRGYRHRLAERVGEYA